MLLKYYLLILNILPLKINKLSKQFLIFLTGSLFVFSFSASSQIQKEFIPRFNDIVNGDVTMIANNMLSRTATMDYNDEDDNHDFIDNVYEQTT